MQDPRAKPSSPTQLLMPLDPERLRGMSPSERRQAVTCRAALLAEAAGPTDPNGDLGEGRTDDGC